MHQHTKLSLVDKFRWVSHLHYAVLLWCMLQAGPPSLNYYYAVMLHSCIVLPPVGHSSNHEYHCCQLTRQLICVSNFYCTFKVFIWLSLVCLFQHFIFSIHHTYPNQCRSFSSHYEQILDCNLFSVMKRAVKWHLGCQWPHTRLHD
jgi:hypothetical protein